LAGTVAIAASALRKAVTEEGQRQHQKVIFWPAEPPQLALRLRANDATLLERNTLISRVLNPYFSAFQKYFLK